ncbi:MAG: hypothetical protein RBR69_01665 [Candidatus Cloacimonadaceae bacterium]|jgi:hypothetical protein|nr:hypothetical protein [Candidatus Cloacimonadota bacterium]MDY0126832.1 hypothetical protein [Candidatus Cloacimonadaceae bacterium]MCB5255074.1 hypothetical protein [Candidatus Cloacimonadota bacterium]MCK9177607.1 hypothetical protein [Candidatus Cloacimonadota bacterium]MCK9241639.1 hypothetical protein [Candidatus Cloacimonadota bacterium]
MEKTLDRQQFVASRVYSSLKWQKSIRNIKVVSNCISDVFKIMKIKNAFRIKILLDKKAGIEDIDQTYATRTTLGA